LLLFVAAGALAQPANEVGPAPEAEPSRLDALLIPEAPASGETLSDSATVSLLTMLPGEEVYSAWGHSALRIADPASGLDRTYNYGTFDFEQPGFIGKFLTGRLDYLLATAPFSQEVAKYQYLERPMIEQRLALAPETVRALYAAIEENARPENAAYRYDFVWDNCSTRLLDMIDGALQASGEASGVNLPAPEAAPTYREVMAPYTDSKPWLDLGIHLGIGLPADQPATPREQTFMPLDLMRLADVATLDGRPLVASRDTVFWIPGAGTPEAPFPWPLAIAWSVFGLAVLGTLWMRRRLRSERMQAWGARGDALLFLLAGLGGVVLLLMWFASDHRVTEKNLELVWLWPTHLLAAVGLVRIEALRAVRGYLVLTAVVTTLVLAAWAFLPEPMHVVGIPLALLLAFRAAMRSVWRPR
ncbi:MAG: DUF4105 domain-containing protein, partial [Bacteroidota bacterium]